MTSLKNKSFYKKLKMNYANNKGSVQYKRNNPIKDTKDLVELGVTSLIGISLIKSSLDFLHSG